MSSRDTPSRGSRVTASNLPLRPVVRTVQPNIVEGRHPDDRGDPPRRPAPRSSQPANVVEARHPDDRGDPPRRPAPRQAPNARGPAGPSGQSRPNDDRQPNPPAEKPPSDLPPLPTSQPLEIDMDGKPAPNLKSDLLGAVYRVINLALDVLEQERSLEMLIQIGATCVKDWGARSNPQEIIYPATPSNGERYGNKQPSNAEMLRWVQIFLQKIRQCFPPIDIRRLEDGTHAMFGLRNWVQDARERCVKARKTPSDENIMLNWHALDSGVMRLHLDSLTAVAQLRSNYLKAKASGDKDGIKRFGTDYQAFLVDGAFTVAHELVHCFVRFLSGDKKVGTPRSLLPKGFEDKPTRGESGRMWEDLVFGGCASYSLPTKKGGTVKIMLEKENKEIQVDPEHIKDISRGKIVFPLKTVGKWGRL